MCIEILIAITCILSLVFAYVCGLFLCGCAKMCPTIAQSAMLILEFTGECKAPKLCIHVLHLFDCFEDKEILYAIIILPKNSILAVAITKIYYKL